MPVASSMKRAAGNAPATGGADISVRISDGSVSGEMQRRALALALEWWHLHRTKLLEDWRLAQAGQPLKKIEPLD
jgi:hypothetical protein